MYAHADLELQWTSIGLFIFRIMVYSLITIIIISENDINYHFILM